MKGRKASDLSLAAAWEYALQVLTRRQRSEKEMEQKLQEKGFPEEIVLAILDRLRAAGLLDDARFARDWAAYRLASHPVGGQRLQRELQEHGVSSALAQEVVAALLPRELELGEARQLAKKYQRRQGEDKGHYCQRLARYLWQRGFASSTVRQVVREIAKDNYIDSEGLKL